MGQAKLRGSYAERRSYAILRNDARLKEYQQEIIPALNGKITAMPAGRRLPMVGMGLMMATLGSSAFNQK